MEAAGIEKRKGEVDVGEPGKIELLRGNLEFRKLSKVDSKTWRLQIGMSVWQPKTRSTCKVVSTTLLVDLQLYLPNIAVTTLRTAARGLRRRATSAELGLTPSITKVRCTSAEAACEVISHENMSI